MSRHRVLLIAEAANPEWVSVPLVGWSHALAISRIADTHLVTHVRNRAAIERFGWREGHEFTAIDSERVARRAYKVAGLLRGGAGKGWTAMTAVGAISYLYFEHLLWQQFRERLTAGQFDAVHRLTPVSPTSPSPLAAKLEKIGVPYVVGPLNGGVRWPRHFDAARRAEWEWLSYVRSAYKLVPGYRSLRRHASAILCGSMDTYAEMPAYAAQRLVYMPENAIDPARFPDESAGSAQGQAQQRVAFVGRLVPYKGVDMLLEATADLVRQGRLRLDIIGDGPARRDLEALAQKLGVVEGVEFAGWVEHAQLHHRLRRSRILGFPSIREFGGGAVIEAMALGLVPVVVGYGGPADIVTERTGIKVPMGPRSEIVRALSAAFETLTNEPKRIDELGEAARRRVLEHFTWSAKAQRSLGVYDWVRGLGPKPEPGMPYPDSSPG